MGMLPSRGGGILRPLARAEYVAAYPAPVAGVVAFVQPVQADRPVGAAGGTPDGRSSRLGGLPRGEGRDRGPVAALHAVDVALERRVHVAAAAGA